MRMAGMPLLTICHNRGENVRVTRRSCKLTALMHGNGETRGTVSCCRGRLFLHELLLETGDAPFRKSESCLGMSSRKRLTTQCLMHELRSGPE